MSSRNKTVAWNLLICGMKLKLVLLLLNVEALVEELDAAAVLRDLDGDDLARLVRNWFHLVENDDTVSVEFSYSSISNTEDWMNSENHPMTSKATLSKHL